MSQKPTTDEDGPEPSWNAEDLAALRKLIAERRKGEFLDKEQSHAQIEAMLAAKRKKYGL